MALLQVMKHIRDLKDPPGHVIRYLKTEANLASETACSKNV